MFFIPLLTRYGCAYLVPPLSSGPTDATTSPQRFPTVLSTFRGDSEALGLSLTRLLPLFNWRRLSVILDSIASRVRDFFRLILVPFGRLATKFDILTTTCTSNSSEGGKSYAQVLTESAQHSRGTFIYSRVAIIHFFGLINFGGKGRGRVKGKGRGKGRGRVKGKGNDLLTKLHTACTVCSLQIV